MALKFQNLLPNPPILRVLRKGKKHYCGICRSDFDTPGEAGSCLSDCWRELCEETDLVAPITDLGRISYLCLLCFRSFRIVETAQTCVDDCIDKGEKKLRRLNILSYLPSETRTKRSFSLRTLVAAPQMHRRLRNKGEATAEAAAEPAAEQTTAISDIGPAPTPDITPGPATETVEVTPTKAVKERKKKHKREFPKSFARRNAKYGCSVCSSEYFTKAEVESCFSGHFDEEGYYYEKEGAA